MPLQNDRAHIVVQHLARRAAKRQKGVLVRLDQGFHPLVGDELDIGRAAPAEGGDKHRKPVLTAADHRPVYLQLLTPLGLKPDHRLGDLLRTQCREE